MTYQDQRLIMLNKLQDYKHYIPMEERLKLLEEFLAEITPEELWSDLQKYEQPSEDSYLVDEFVKQFTNCVILDVDDYSRSGYISKEGLREMEEELTDNDKLFLKLVFSDIGRKEAFSTIEESRQKRRVPRRRVSL